MPITKSAQKALRVSLRRRDVNIRVRSQMKTAIDAFLAKSTAENLRRAFQAVDIAVKKQLLHRNTAARRKSLLARKLSSATK